ncbi:MAG: phosphatase PAP2 family protein [Fidelibacterota bacterium]
MKHLFALLFILGFIHPETTFSKMDLSLSTALEGNNRSASMDFTMEMLALSTPFIEFGYAGILQMESHNLHSLALSALGVQLPIAMGKYIVNRDRPNRQYKPRLWNSRRTPSFPSGHAATTAAWATTINLNDPQTQSIMIGYVLISGYSQVYVGNHYISDVLAGWILGWATALFFHRSFESNQNKSARAPFLRISIPL